MESKARKWDSGVENRKNYSQARDYEIEQKTRVKVMWILVAFSFLLAAIKVIVTSRKQYVYEI